MNRRQFLKTSGLTAGSLLLDYSCIGAAHLQPSQRRPSIAADKKHPDLCKRCIETVNA